MASELARRGWAPALTRDGLERTDILAVFTQSKDRRMVEVQVKTAQSSPSRTTNWPLGSKAQQPSQHEREYFVLVAVPPELDAPPRSFVVPRSHIAAAAWIEHMNWLTDPNAELGKRNARAERARVKLQPSNDTKVDGICCSPMNTTPRCYFPRVTETSLWRTEWGCRRGTLGTPNCRNGSGGLLEPAANSLDGSDLLTVKVEQLRNYACLFLIP